MLVVAVAEKSQRNRFMLELRARQRYHNLKTAGLIRVLDHCQFLCLFNMPVPAMRLPQETLGAVARYVSAFDEMAMKRLQRENKVAQWLAYHQLFAYGAALSVGLMDWRLIGFHRTITVDGVIAAPPNYALELDLTVGTYLRLYWNRSVEYNAEGEIIRQGSWRVTNYLPAETNPHHDVGFLNIEEADNGIDLNEVVVCVYSKLPEEMPDEQMLYDQYNVVIMGKSDRYCYDEWEELYWPFTSMVCLNRHLEETNQL